MFRRGQRVHAIIEHVLVVEIKKRMHALSAEPLERAADGAMVCKRSDGRKRRAVAAAGTI